jgi:hypothetical protein
MPLESIIAVSAVVVALTVFAATLAWVQWFAGGKPTDSTAKSPAE